MDTCYPIKMTGQTTLFHFPDEIRVSPAVDVVEYSQHFEEEVGTLIITMLHSSGFLLYKLGGYEIRVAVMILSRFIATILEVSLISR